MKKQAGFGLMVMLIVIVLAGTYVIVSKLSAANTHTAARKEHNARVLQQAKQALIGYVVMKAGQTGENDPGTFPCPEAPAYYSNPAQEGEAAGSCATPAVGRLPWRTLGIDKLTDAWGEPLWYVVSPGWHKPSPGGWAVVNSNSRGQLTVDGLANSAVALIIAPGAPLASTAAGCAGITQSRNAASANVVNYLDCDNSTPADSSFTTTGPAGSFNDQVLRITARQVIPSLETAIAPRIQREIVPALRTVYATNAWGNQVNADHPWYPYAAPFTDPAMGSSYKGASNICAAGISPYACQGLLPAVFVGEPAGAGVCAVASGSACDPNFVRWTSGNIEVTEVTVDGVVYTLGTIVSGVLSWSLQNNNCTVATVNGGTPREHTELRCMARVPGLSGYASNNVRYRVRGTAINVGMAFRQFDTTGFTIQTAPTATVNSAGTASMTFEGRINVPAGSGNLIGSILGGLSQCGLNVLGVLTGLLTDLQCREIAVTVPISFFGDAPLVNAKHPDIGWFARNEWYRVMYYATARDVTPARPSGAEPKCNAGDDECLDLDATNPQKNALLLLAGRSLNGTVGHTRTLTDLLDLAENRDTGRRFETRPLGATYNDRIWVVQDHKK
jgi:hypothetical protein